MMSKPTQYYVFKHFNIYSNQTIKKHIYKW